MSTWILEAELSLLLFVGLLPLLVAPFLAWVYRRYRYPAPAPTLLAVASGLYASALVSFTTFPLPEAPEGFCTQRRIEDYWQLIPGNSLGPVAELAREVGWVETLSSGVFLQVAFNVVFFMPLGFLLAYWARRSLAVTALVGLGVSLLIETSQGTGLWGLYPCPYRLADVDDLIANTAGAALGWLLGWGLTRIAPYREPEPRTDASNPTVRRRTLAAGLDMMIVVVATFATDIVVQVGATVRGAQLDATSAVWTAVQVGVGALLLLLLPLVRADRATPGQLTVLLGTAARAERSPARRSSLVVRFVVRWLPVLILGLPALMVVGIVELLVIAVRRDRRSLSGVLSGSRTLTHDQMRGH
jgi:glycopeptide antibiotics resistance protein